MVALPVQDRDSVPGLSLVVPEFEPTTGPMSIWKINKLEQVRKTYDGIVELADEFAVAGWLSDPLVALLTPGQAGRYLDYVNRVYDAEHRLNDLIVFSHRPRRRYAILIAGHCRLLANYHLWSIGCTHCRKDYGPEAPGVCYQRHAIQHGQSVDGVISVKIHEGIDPCRALGKQFSENRYNRPPAHEIADGLDRWFAVERYENPSLTATAFCRIAGTNPDTFRRAQSYCRLPEGLRRDVEERRLGYGSSLALGRLGNHFGFDDNVLVSYKEQIVLNKMSTAAVEKMVDELIDMDESGNVVLQYNESREFGFETVTTAQKARRRQVFEQQAVNYAHTLSRYFGRAAPLIQSGKMGDFSDAVYLDTSALSVFREAVAWLDLVLPLLEHKLAQQEAEDARRTIDRGLLVIDSLIDRAQAKNPGSLFAVAGN